MWSVAWKGVTFSKAQIEALEVATHTKVGALWQAYGYIVQNSKHFYNTGLQSNTIIAIVLEFVHYQTGLPFLLLYFAFLVALMDRTVKSDMKWNEREGGKTSAGRNQTPGLPVNQSHSS